MENAISVLKEIMARQYDAGRAGKGRPENAGEVKEALEYILEAIREDSLHHISEEEIQSLGLWCGGSLEELQEEAASSLSPLKAFRQSGEDLVGILIKRGWTPPSPK